MPDLNEERNPAAEQTEVNPLKTTTGGFSFSDFIFRINFRVLQKLLGFQIFTLYELECRKRFKTAELDGYRLNCSTTNWLLCLKWCLSDLTAVVPTLVHVWMTRKWNARRPSMVGVTTGRASLTPDWEPLSLPADKACYWFKGEITLFCLLSQIDRLYR